MTRGPVPMVVYAVEAWQELRAGLRTTLVPLMFVALVAYVLLVLTSAQYLREMGGAEVPRNSALVVYQVTSGQAFWLIFVWAWVFAQVVTRDRSAHLHELVLTAPVSLRGLLVARYLGALLLACLLGSSTSIGFLLVPLLGRLGVIPPSAVGPAPLAVIGHAWVLFVLPSAAGLGALYLVAALRTRSSVGPFAASAVIVLLWMGAMVALRNASLHADLATLVDVSGFGEAEYQSKRWTPAEKASAMLALTGPLLGNRLLWTLGPLALLGLSLLGVRRESLVGERDATPRAATAPASRPALVGGELAPARRVSWAAVTWLEARWQAGRLLSGWPFLLAMALWFAINVGAPFAHMTGHAEGPLVPRGQLLAPFLLDLNFIFSVFGIAAFVGALVRRDQLPGMAEIVDATPAPLGARVVGSALAAGAVTLVFVLVPALSAWLVMAITVPEAFDPWSPLLVSGLLAAPALLELAAIVFLTHALVRSPGTAHALSMFAALVAVVNHELGIVSYPPAVVGIPAHVRLSEWAGFAPWLPGVAVLDLLKLGIVALLLALAWSALARGTALTTRSRLRDAARRLRGAAGALALGASLVIAATAWVLRDRLVVRGTYRSAQEVELRDASWERAFWTHARPFRVAEGEVAVTIDPHARTAHSVVALKGVRATSDHLLGHLPEGARRIVARVAGRERPVTVVDDDFLLALGGCPADGCEVTLELDLAADGWNLEYVPPWLDTSGIWARASDLVPRLGLDAERRLRSPSVRRAHGLPDVPEPVPAAALAPARGVLPTGRYRWRIEVSRPGVHTALEGELEGPLDFAFVWQPSALGGIRVDRGVSVWHGPSRASLAAEVLEDLRVMQACLETRLGLSAEVDTVLQAPRGLGELGLHGRVLWIPEDEGWDVTSRGVGRTKRLSAIGEALAATLLARAADLRVEAGSRLVTSGLAGGVALDCARARQGGEAWLAWMARRSEAVPEALGALAAPLVGLADDGPAAWVGAYAPLATLAWARGQPAAALRERIGALMGGIRAGEPVASALVHAAGAGSAELLLGVPFASDLAIESGDGRLAVRGVRARWKGGGWEEAPSPQRVTWQLDDAEPELKELPLDLGAGRRVTVFDAHPSFERSPLDNSWPRAEGK